MQTKVSQIELIKCELIKPFKIWRIKKRVSSQSIGKDSLTKVRATLVLNTPWTCLRPSIPQGDVSPCPYGKNDDIKRLGQLEMQELVNVLTTWTLSTTGQYGFFIGTIYFIYFYFFIFHSHCYWKDMIIMGKLCFSFLIRRGFCMVSF